jgi:hypothetical protein
MDPAVITTQEILDGRSSVLWVVHEGGPGGWQFYDVNDATERELVAIEKEQILALDPSLVEVTDLPMGWYAWREAPGKPWQRALFKNGEADEEEDGPELVDYEDLSPEAQKFLDDAPGEFAVKLESLERDWKWNSIRESEFDWDSGLLRLDFEGGERVEAKVQMLGSYSVLDKSWQWPWVDHDGYVSEELKADSLKIKALGERLGLTYLCQDNVPMPKELLRGLCELAVKATDSLGVFEIGYEGPEGKDDLFIYHLSLKELRWINPAA